MKDYPSRDKNQRPNAAHPLKWLSQPTRHQALFQHAQQLMDLEHAVQALLPAPLRTGCRVLQFEQGVLVLGVPSGQLNRKSTRLNSSHVAISYAGFCLKKKNTNIKRSTT